MAFSRTAALRSCFRAARPSIARPQLLRQVARRGYASGGHGSAKAGGDAVWAAGAVTVTIPTCWYLLSNGPDTSHAHDSHGKSHGKEHKEESTEEGEAEEKSEDDEKKSEDSEEKNDSASEESHVSSSDKKDADTPATSDDEKDAEPEAKNTRKHIPDAKGGAKARLESNKGMKLGETDDESGDKASASRSAENHNTQTGKQEGLSNTDTKHSTDITEDPGKSKKGEGAPDTAKLKGTVDPKRPQA